MRASRTKRHRITSTHPSMHAYHALNFVASGSRKSLKSSIFEHPPRHLFLSYASIGSDMYISIHIAHQRAESLIMTCNQRIANTTGASHSPILVPLVLSTSSRYSKARSLLRNTCTGSLLAVIHDRNRTHNLGRLCKRGNVGALRRLSALVFASKAMESCQNLIGHCHSYQEAMIGQILDLT
jgi:hypothetical protein